MYLHVFAQFKGYTVDYEAVFVKLYQISENMTLSWIYSTFYPPLKNFAILYLYGI